MKAKQALNKSTFILFIFVATLATFGFEITEGQSKETPSPVLTIVSVN